MEGLRHVEISRSGLFSLFRYCVQLFPSIQGIGVSILKAPLPNRFYFEQDQQPSERGSAIPLTRRQSVRPEEGKLGPKKAHKQNNDRDIPYNPPYNEAQ